MVTRAGAGIRPLALLASCGLLAAGCTPAVLAAQDPWREDSTVASIAFGRVVADSEVVALLRRHDVRPYVVYMNPGGVHEVPRETT